MHPYSLNFFEAQFQEKSYPQFQECSMESPFTRVFSMAQIIGLTKKMYPKTTCKHLYCECSMSERNLSYC